MTLREIVFDLITILTKAGFTDDSRLDEDYLGYKANEKRAKAIRDSYRRNKFIDPVWLQDFGVFDLTEVNKADDKTFSEECTCKISKATLPAIVSLLDGQSTHVDLGINSLRSVCGTKEYHFEGYNRLYTLLNLPEDNIALKFKYFTRVQNAIYVAPSVDKLRGIFILENPLDGFVRNTENILSGNLVTGTVYEVTEGQIVHNALGHNKGQTFTAVNANFTGSGKVQLVNQKRAMTDEDPYPVSFTMMEEIILKILTQEFNIEKGVIADIRNDSIDQLEILGNEK